MTQRVFAVTEDPGEVLRLVQLTLSGTMLAEANVLSADVDDPAVAASRDGKYVAILRSNAPVVFTHTTGDSYVEHVSSDSGDANAGDCFPAIAMTPSGDWIAMPKIHPDV